MARARPRHATRRAITLHRTDGEPARAARATSSPAATASTASAGRRSPAGVLRVFERDVPVRLARHPRRGAAVARGADLRAPRARLRAAQHALARRSPGSTCSARRTRTSPTGPTTRIWEELHARLGPTTAGRSTEGPILEKGVTRHAQLRRRADAVRPALPRRRRRAHRAADRREGPEPRRRRRARARARRSTRVLRDGPRRRCSTPTRDTCLRARLARRALLVVDDVDAAPVPQRRRLRPPAAARAARLRRRPRAPPRRASPRTTSACRSPTTDANPAP